MFFVSIGAGIVLSIARFAVLFFVSLFAIIRMDRPLLADWVVRNTNMDPANVTYVAQVYNHHRHNNPVMLTFFYLLRNLNFE